MDFADDFTYFTFDDVLREAKDLYRHNKHIIDIKMDAQAKHGPTLVFRINTRKKLSLKQLGLPAQFRRFRTEIAAANDRRF